MTLRTPIRWALAAVVLGIGICVFRRFTRLCPNRSSENAFGQTHVHTSWSFDAYVFGNTMTGPEEACKFALGQPIKHPGG